MKAVIIYTNTGEILATLMGENVSAANGANIIETDIPDGYTFSSVNPETGEPVLEVMPKTEEQQRIEALEAQMNALLGVDESEETE